MDPGGKIAWGIKFLVFYVHLAITRCLVNITSFWLYYYFANNSAKHSDCCASLDSRYLQAIRLLLTIKMLFYNFVDSWCMCVAPIALHVLCVAFYDLTVVGSDLFRLLVFTLKKSFAYKCLYWQLDLVQQLLGIVQQVLWCACSMDIL